MKMEKEVMINLLKDMVSLKEIESNLLDISRKMGYDTLEERNGCIQNAISDISFAISEYTGIDIDRIIDVDSNTISGLIDTINQNDYKA